MTGLSVPVRRRVESALGSHPIWMTFFPLSARASVMLEDVVDFPIPPLPYMAILRVRFRKTGQVIKVTNVRNTNHGFV